MDFRVPRSGCRHCVGAARQSVSCPALRDGRLYCDTAAAAAAVTAAAQGHLSVALHQGRLPRRAAATRQATGDLDERSI